MILSMYRPIFGGQRRIGYVVAGEVRNLAAKSAEAARNTNVLISRFRIQQGRQLLYMKSSRTGRRSPRLLLFSLRRHGSGGRRAVCPQNRCFMAANLVSWH